LPLSVEIDANDVVCKDFIGFGAEWDSRNYHHAGITEEDFDIIRTRVEWMRLPAARIMMQCKWCYKGNGKYDWESEEMVALYRHLDVCQSLGTTVFLADWGCEAEWLHCPEVAEVQDPKYAEIIAAYMGHLLRQKGYTCIKHFIMGNEPNYEVEDWDRWKTGILNVHTEFKKHGLADEVILTGTDHVDNDDWHRWAVDQLPDTLGAYDFHCYASADQIRKGELYEYFKKSWDYARERDPKGESKPCVVGEAGLNDGADHPYGNATIDSADYGIIMSDYAIQAANAGSAAVFAWMLDDNSHPGFYWGMWSNKEKGMQLRPWFYPWSLLSRYVPQGSHVVRTTLSSPDVRAAAACMVDGRSATERLWTFCLVNRAKEPKTVRLHLTGGHRVRMDRYVFSGTSAKRNEGGFPSPLDHEEYDLGVGADVMCEAESVVILSSME